MFSWLRVSIAGAVLALIVGGFFYGRHTQSVADAAITETVRANILQQQKDALATLTEKNNKRTADLLAFQEQLRKQLEDLKNDKSAQVAGVCLDADAVDRLRKLAIGG